MERRLKEEREIVSELQGIARADFLEGEEAPVPRANHGFAGARGVPRQGQPWRDIIRVSGDAFEYAEGRLSGVVLIALPFLLFVVMLHVRPDYIEMLWTTEMGRKMSFWGLVFQILGAVVIKKIVDIKV